MSISVSTSGYIAVASFLIFTGLGTFVQVYKLIQRTKAWKLGTLERDIVCDGLHPVREMWSFTAFLLFALSGLTRTYIDYFLLFSRLPVIILCTVILWFLQFHQGKKARRYFLLAVCGNLFFILLIVLAIIGFRFDQSLISKGVDGVLSVVSVLLFYGKSLQALTMYREKRSHAVSWLRELGNVIKDLTGLYYSLLVGSELIWVSITHALSAISSGTICVVKYLLERKPTA